jgi:hypothetical protein
VVDLAEIQAAYYIEAATRSTSGMYSMSTGLMTPFRDELFCFCL